MVIQDVNIGEVLTNCPDTSGYLVGKFSNLDQMGNPGSHVSLSTQIRFFLYLDY